MIKKVLASIVALVFVALLGYRVAAARNDTQSRAEDRVQIEKLMWSYDRTLEGGNIDAYVALYTPDGQFGTGAKAVKGRDALKKMLADLKQSRDEAVAKGQIRLPVYIMDFSSYLEFSDRDHARMKGYWMEVTPQSGSNGPASIVAAGRYVQEFARTNGQWLIKLRDVAPKD
jgi:hypothetical protein